MAVEFPALHKVLKDPTRREILRCLSDKGPLPYVELMSSAEVTNTGRFNYHLKVMNGLLEKQSDGRYGLTERGRLAVQMLDKFPERAIQMPQQKKAGQKLVVVAAILLAGIIVVSILLIILAYF